MNAVLIYNPVAGLRDVEQELNDAIAFLRAQGWDVTLRKTWGPGDATTYAREAVANRADMVVAVGGDGTIGQVATGLAFSDCVLGVLPVGTGNVYANMVGLPVWTPLHRSTLVDAARILVEGETRLIDVGQVGQRYFVMWTGIGFDAEVARGVEPHRELRRRLGNITYYVALVAVGMGLRGTRTTVTIDGQVMRQRILCILVSNAQFYGGTVRFAPQARLDDGLLDVYIFKGSNLLDALRHIFLVVWGKQLEDPQLEVFQAKEIIIRPSKPLPVQVDGDPTGYTPITIQVVPKALKVRVPAHVSPSLFAGGEDAQDLSLGQRLAERWQQEKTHWRAEGERLRRGWGRWWGLPPQEKS